MLDEAFFAERFERAIELRRTVVSAGTDAFRLINGEGDGLPGLIADSFAGHLVLQVGTPGMQRLQSSWLPALEQVARPRSALLKPNQSAANQERMSAPAGQLSGSTPAEIEIREHGLGMVVDPARGQKTGFFCDQRDNRRLMAGLARDRKLLDCYSYTGAFAAHALVGGAATVTCVESSAPARGLLERNLESAGGAGERRILGGDAVEFLRGCEEQFDVAIVDPPALAKRRRHLDRASRLYREIFSRAASLLTVGGVLLACSCSAAVDRASFDQIVVSAVRVSGRDARFLHRGGAASDHPVSAFHPEGDYLKTALLQVH
ncbi:MAG: class I SAM-dependent rRNA methyltransferase [Deltaproteobacteria bacterium]|nr:class I SAM-dependent rRNA methyltransferase [Deltaproteobacteria bacterium]